MDNKIIVIIIAIILIVIGAYLVLLGSADEVTIGYLPSDHDAALSLKCKNTTTSASCGWIALLGVLSFLINFIVFYFICVFLRLFYVMNFYSVYFFVIGLLNNCFGFEKLLWVRYSITFQMLSLIFYIGVIINEILFN